MYCTSIIIILKVLNKILIAPYYVSFLKENLSSRNNLVITMNDAKGITVLTVDRTFAKENWLKSPVLTKYTSLHCFDLKKKKPR